jgi:hypothetical protein
VSGPLQNKFQIITTTQLPHKCVACGSEADGRKEFIDFGISFDFEGCIYFCMGCAEEVARTIGFITSEELESALSRTEAMERELEEERNRVRALTDTFTAFNIPDDNPVNGSDSDLQIDTLFEAGQSVSEGSKHGPFE